MHEKNIKREKKHSQYTSQQQFMCRRKNLSFTTHSTLICCTSSTEIRWCRKLTSVDSPVLSEILLPVSFNRLLAEELRTPRVSTAIGSKR